MRKLKICFLLITALLLVANLGFSAEEALPKTSAGKVIFGFEKDMLNMGIPDWAFEKDDHVAKSVALSNKFASEGKSSLEVMANFPGAKWTAAYVEVEQFFDWTPYKTISADIYLPKDAPFGLQARFTLSVGEDYTWVEMTRLFKLAPGEWTTVSANLSPGSTDWRKQQVTDQFRANVQKLGIRIESNMRPTYSGPIYIDNVRVE